MCTSRRPCIHKDCMSGLWISFMPYVPNSTTFNGKAIGLHSEWEGALLDVGWFYNLMGEDWTRGFLDALRGAEQDPLNSDDYFKGYDSGR